MTYDLNPISIGFYNSLTPGLEACGRPASGHGRHYLFILDPKPLFRGAHYGGKMKCCCLGISNLPPSFSSSSSSSSSVLTGKCRFRFHYYYSPPNKRPMRFRGFHALRCHKMYVPGNLPSLCLSFMFLSSSFSFDLLSAILPA